MHLLKASNVLKPTSKAYVTKRVTDVKNPYNFFPSGCVSFRLEDMQMRWAI